MQYLLFNIHLLLNLGLTPKEQSLLMEIRKRKSELLVEIQVQKLL